MDREREKEAEKEAIERKLVTCRTLAREFPHGETAKLIRDMEGELSEQLRSLEAQ